MSSDNVVSLYSYLGMTWIIGCYMFGLVVIRKNRECFISRQNLCQSSLLLCGLTLCGATQVQDYAGNVMFGRFCIIGHFFYSNFLSLYIWSHSWWVSIFSEDVCLWKGSVKEVSLGVEFCSSFPGSFSNSWIASKLCCGQNLWIKIQYLSQCQFHFRWMFLHVSNWFLQEEGKI